MEPMVQIKPTTEYLENMVNILKREFAGVVELPR